MKGGGGGGKKSFMHVYINYFVVVVGIIHEKLNNKD